jgi:polysaccharide biosynthesis/export protein
MVRIILVICSILILQSCAVYEAKIEQGQEVTVEKTSFSFDDKNYDFFSHYRVSAGDQLEVLFSMQAWEKETEYQVAIGDTLEVKFFNAPKYDTVQKIRPDGKISLPFIGDYEAAGKSAKTIREKLTALYAEIFREPNINVMVPEYLAQLKELKGDLHTPARGLSRLVSVRPDGYATFPMVGEFEVGHKTIKELTAALNLQYAKISPHVKVDLFLEKHSGSVFYALGAVNHQGAHELVHPISILEALALAKGKADGSAIDEVIIYRKHNKQMVATRVNVADMLTVADDSKMFFIDQDDIVYVPEASSVQMGRGSKRIADIMLFRGW